MNKILNGYKSYVMSNESVNTVKAINEDDLKSMDSLKRIIRSEGIYSTKAYDDYINWLCDTFKVECCFTCGKHIFLDDLDCCEGCDEYICNSCKESGCSCDDGIPDEDDYEDNINCYYL